MGGGSVIITVKNGKTSISFTYNNIFRLLKASTGYVKLIKNKKQFQAIFTQWKEIINILCFLYSFFLSLYIFISLYMCFLCENRDLSSSSTSSSCQYSIAFCSKTWCDWEKWITDSESTGLNELKSLYLVHAFFEKVEFFYQCWRASSNS